MQLREWNARLHGLVVFRALLGDPVVAKLAALTDRLEAADDTIAPLCDAVAAFEAALFAEALRPDAGHAAGSRRPAEPGAGVPAPLGGKAA